MPALLLASSVLCFIRSLLGCSFTSSFSFVSSLVSESGCEFLVLVWLFRHLMLYRLLSTEFFAHDIRLRVTKYLCILFALRYISMTLDMLRLLHCLLNGLQLPCYCICSIILSVFTIPWAVALLYYQVAITATSIVNSLAIVFRGFCVPSASQLLFYLLWFTIFTQG